MALALISGNMNVLPPLLQFLSKGKDHRMMRQCESLYTM